MALTDSQQAPAGTLRAPGQVRSLLKLIVVLFKLRVVSLLLLSAFGGAALGIAAGGHASLENFLLLTITGTMAAAGASAINQYLEIDRDSKMRRTAKRPLATGQIRNPHIVLLLGGGLVAGASTLALLAQNQPLAFWLLMGAIIYVGVYTIWLKPRTTLNIVIGGAAGSCAVISGGAAVGVPLDLGVWILAALIFVWTPVHFWALALAYRDDYVEAGYPMLPARVSAKVAAGWTALHTVLTIAAALGLAFAPQFDWILVTIISLSSLPLIKKTVAMLVKPERSTAFPLFTYSNIFLTIVLLAVMGSLLWR
ncbi:MAG: heme o synthase [Ardenticatenaceae bacterium]|nr:heme o synthase [Ardenticatenaceae bacterium]